MKINNEFIQYLDSISFPYQLSIFNNHSKLFSKNNGFRDINNQLPIQDDTIFGIASGTKIFTALGILILVESNQLSLDSLLSDFLGDNFSQYDKKVAIKHLLTHTSGIPDYYDEEHLQEGEFFHPSTPWSELYKPSDYLSVMPNRPNESIPGENFKYNNSGFVLLAYIIQKITGDYHKFIEDEILKKCKMNHSGFYRFDQLPPNTANGYITMSSGVKRLNIYELPIIGSGDGGMYSCAEDMDLFWNALFSGVLISSEMLRKMLLKHSSDGNSFYGYGVWLNDFKHQTIPFVVGMDPGVSFYSIYHPSENISVTILSNEQEGVWGIKDYIEKNVLF